MITYFLDLYDQIYFFFSTANWDAIVLILKITSWLISALLIWLIIILLKRADAAWWVRERVFASEFAYGKSEDDKWRQIMVRIKKGDEANLKLAVIEADNLIDDILKRMGLSGNDMAERLKQIQVQEIASVDKIWSTHAIRNKIVHEPNFHLSQEDAEKAVRNIEDALRDLEYLS